MDPEPTMESLSTFIGITGASEAVAIRLLQESGGDLNAAVNAFFNERDAPGRHEGPEPQQVDYMDEDEPPVPISAPTTESRGPAWGGISRSGFNPLGIFQRPTSPPAPPAPPVVSYPREVRNVPIQWQDDAPPIRGAGNLSIQEMTDVDNVPGGHPGIVSLNDDELPPFPVAPGYPRHPEHETYVPQVTEAPSVPQVDYDVEEEMLQAALEESRRMNAGASGPSNEDEDIARAVSLSLKTAEDEKRWRDLAYDDTDVPLTLDSTTRVNPVNVVPPEEPEEEPLLRRRSRRVVPVVEEPVEGGGGGGASGDHAASAPQANGDPLRSDEWGGISSEEHDEAVMLEAVFGGGLAGLPYPLQQNFDPSLATNSRRPAAQPLSPSVVAQRLLREQQDDEYLASLAADREKELKAQQEAEVASQKEKQRLEEEQRKLQAEVEMEKRLAAKAGTLPPEPSQDDDSGVTILVRLPDGSRHGRRFRKSDKLEHLFDFVDLSRAVKPGTYRLVRQYPRRTFTYDERSASLDSLGLTSKQEALFLETI